MKERKKYQIVTSRLTSIIQSLKNNLNDAEKEKVLHALKGNKIKGWNKPFILILFLSILLLGSILSLAIKENQEPIKLEFKTENSTQQLPELSASLKFSDKDFDPENQDIETLRNSHSEYTRKLNLIRKKLSYSRTLYSQLIQNLKYEKKQVKVLVQKQVRLERKLNLAQKNVFITNQQFTEERNRYQSLENGFEKDKLKQKIKYLDYRLLKQKQEFKEIQKAENESRLRIDEVRSFIDKLEKQQKELENEIRNDEALKHVLQKVNHKIQLYLK